MRVASVVTPVLAALLASLAAGCTTSQASRFCSAMTSSKLDFADTAHPTKELAALDQVIAELSPRDRHLVVPVRDYARLLYNRSSWSAEQKVAFLTRFFHVDAPKLDKRLRDDCDVPLNNRIAPFYAIPKGNA